MHRKSLFPVLPLASIALSFALAAPAWAGGHGGGGDSSNNPYIGDSYAYFHGGHNLGEQGMIMPGRNNRAPAAAGTASDAPQTNATAAGNPSSAASTSNAPRFRPAETPQR